MPVHILPRRWPPRARGRSRRGQLGNRNYFSFVIDSRNRSRFGDSLAFFLALAGSKIPDDTTKGSTLGLHQQHGHGHHQEGKALPQLSLPPRLCPYPSSSVRSGHCQLLLDATTSSPADASSSSSVPLSLYSDLIVNSDPDIWSALEKCQLQDTREAVATPTAAPIAAQQTKVVPEQGNDDAPSKEKASQQFEDSPGDLPEDATKGDTGEKEKTRWMIKKRNQRSKLRKHKLQRTIPRVNHLKES
ncbi:hypothetical protein MLD38_020987 [Melastoma candidum]|uniref:Uncharacterized protein n=1 Tax=Melastoma candidum TaxID=119954 RepID=A0ACB9QF69_9MYRT|nr:hypothetical protein MLD38_020987 [Melastoma candidum]